MEEDEDGRKMRKVRYIASISSVLFPLGDRATVSPWVNVVPRTLKTLRGMAVMGAGRLRRTGVVNGVGVACCLDWNDCVSSSKLVRVVG